jgi:hypothetical protein
MHALAFCIIVAAAPVPQTTAARLPLRALVLYENGLGYFERKGPMREGQVAEIPLEPGQLDDALKSAVIISNRGVAAVEFAPPLSAEAARALAGLPEPEALKDLGVVLSSLKGVDVSVSRIDGPGALGRVLEVAQEQEYDLKGNALPAPTLLVFGELGLQRVRLSEIAAVRPLNAAVALAWDRAVSSASAQPQTQSLKVRAGRGAGVVAVGYTTEAPVWRTTYRLIQSKSKTRLQAFALVHNDSDEPWNGVKVTLASGRPTSFLFPLAGPRYSRRELVAPEDGLDAAPQLATAEAREHLTGSIRGSVGLGGLGTVGLGSGGGGYGSDAAIVGGRNSVHGGVSPSDLLAEGPTPLEPAAVSEAGELFLYTVKEPVFLGSRKSALLPIIDDGITAEPVSVIGSSDPNATLAMRLTNSTPLTLERGTLSVFTDGTYSGESRLDRLKPHEVRIIRHGEDLDLEAEVSLQSEEGPVQAVRPVAKTGFIEFHRVDRRIHKLNLTSRSAKKRTVLLELDSEGYRVVAGAEEDVRSPGQPRYARLVLEPRQTRAVDVIEEGAMVERVNIDGLSSARLTALRAEKTSSKVRGVLIALRAEIVRVESAKARQRAIDLRVKELEGDVVRVRENLTAAGKGGANKVAEELGQRLLQLEAELSQLRAERLTQESTIAAAKQAALAAPGMVTALAPRP